MLKVSATIPWPAKAASPWMSTGKERCPSASLKRSCLARTLPCTTGSIHSRWLGLKARERRRPPSAVSRVLEYPRWYFTSPPTAPLMMAWSRNSAKMSRRGLASTLASTLSRPRWAIPMTTLRTP